MRADKSVSLCSDGVLRQGSITMFGERRSTGHSRESDRKQASLLYWKTFYPLRATRHFVTAWAISCVPQHAKFISRTTHMDSSITDLSLFKVTEYSENMDVFRNVRLLKFRGKETTVTAWLQNCKQSHVSEKKPRKYQPIFIGCIICWFYTGCCRLHRRLWSVKGICCVRF